MKGVEAQPVVVESLEALCRRGSLRAILEAVDAPAVPEMVERLGPEGAVSLFQGMPEEEDWALAPYLLEVDEATLGWIRKTLWSGASWGILFESARTVEELRRHFRQWVVVEDPNGDEMLFRFYDALVLKTFLGSATREEAADFFGPVTAFFGVFEEPGKAEPVLRAFRKPWREATTRVHR